MQGRLRIEPITKPLCFLKREAPTAISGGTASVHRVFLAENPTLLKWIGQREPGGGLELNERGTHPALGVPRVCTSTVNIGPIDEVCSRLLHPSVIHPK